MTAQPVTAPRVFYAIRQARTRIIGSPVYTRAEAEREAAAWAADIGPAVAVLSTPALAQAVRCYDQDALGEILYPPVPPVLTAAEARILAEVKASGRRMYNGHAARQLERLESLGLVVVDWYAGSSRVSRRYAVTPAAPCAHPRRRCSPVPGDCLCGCRPCTDRRNTP
jgi:hypothetical protein